MSAYSSLINPHREIPPFHNDMRNVLQQGSLVGRFVHNHDNAFELARVHAASAQLGEVVFQLLDDLC